MSAPRSAMHFISNVDYAITSCVDIPLLWLHFFTNGAANLSELLLSDYSDKTGLKNYNVIFLLDLMANIPIALPNILR